MTASLLAQLLEALAAEAEGDAVDLLGHARQRVARGHDDQALPLLGAALRASHSREDEYAPVTEALALWFDRRGEGRAALAASWYGMGRKSQARWIDAGTPSDRARTWLGWVARGEMERDEACSLAADALEAAGLLARAALALEEGRKPSAARALWARLADRLDAGAAEPYAAGLARFNVARTSHALGDTAAARRASVLSVQRLEEAADRFETRGQRERAFDAYQVLVEIGRLTGVVEHTLEGAVNAARILAEDHLPHHALRLHEQAMEAAERAGELAAGATLANDLALLAERHGLADVAREGVVRRGELWEAAAARPGAPRGLARHALLASAAAHVESGRLESARRAFRRLADLDLPGKEREHYADSARRLQGEHDPDVPRRRAREALGPAARPPEVWKDDLLEWEARGLASEACADVLFEQGADHAVTRRTALVGRLVAQLAEGATGWPDRTTAPAGVDRSAALVALAGHLAPIEMYGVLAPLERLAMDADAAVRLAAVQAVQGYFYKRSFVTLERALGDSDAIVVAAARSAVERLRFDHALEPLARIARSRDPESRAAALRAIARIDVEDAAHLLLATLDHGGPEERGAALEAMKSAATTAFVDAARSAFPRASPRLRAAVTEIFRARSLRV